MADIDQFGEPLLRLRTRNVIVFLVLVFIIFATRLFYLQVIKHGYYESLALSNRIQRERITAPRGLIRARDGSKLVVNVPVYQISILPRRLGDDEERLALACRWLDIDEKSLKQALSVWVARYPDGREMTVVQAADKQQISVLRENRALFPFFRLVMIHRREYPEGSLACHVLGYVGEVTDDELQDSRNLQQGDIIGRTGIEYAYDEQLRGEDGVRVVEISAEGIRVGEVEGYLAESTAEELIGSRLPVPGNDLILTIDLDLQRIVEEAFTWERGSVVIMDPQTGEILAAVSRPVYDPNIFRAGVSGEMWKTLFDDPEKPLFNRTVQAAYPPGSVFKLITAYAALTNDLITTSTRFVPCNGGYQFGNRYFRCWKPEGHGSLNLHGAIVNSCNVYFYQVGEILEADQFASAGRIFGLGRRTGVDLPSEVTGILPDEQYYDRRFGKHKWTQGNLLNYSTGQGEVLATPLQICAMTAIFANDGYRVIPHFIKRIVDADGGVVEEDRWVPIPLQKLDRNAMTSIQRAMVGVTSDEHGTGRAAAVAGVEVAGKTGTAQNPHGEDHALFVAYAPAGDPEIVMTIVLENAGHGGAMAAPMARKILSAWFLTMAGGNLDREVAAETGP